VVPVSISLLGPLLVQVGADEVPVTAARERALLARLALSPGTPVSVDVLVDELWADDPPASATATLQTYASHLRRLVAPASIERVGSAYRLSGAEVDVHQAEQVISGSSAAPPVDDTERRRDLRRVLATWRGPSLADAGDGAGVAAHRARLEQLRLQATEELAQRDLDAGLHQQLVPQLEARCLEHPHHEPFAALAALALYRSGRQADALAVLRRLRHALLDDLGLDPSPKVAELESLLLQQDPSLEASPVPAATRDGAVPDDVGPSPVPLPPRLVSGRADPPIIGRRNELARLQDHLELAERGETPPLVVVEGEAGIGKTRLAREMSLLASGRGATVLWGRCLPSSGGSLVPIAEALDHLVRHDRRVAVGYEGLLAAILPSLSAGLDPLVVLRVGDEQRWALLEAVVAVLHRRAERHPLLLVIDDLQWADPASLSLLEHLAVSGIAGMLMLATVRTPEPTEVDALAPTLARLDREQRLDRLAVRGLGASELRVLLDRTTGGAASVQAVEALERQTRGNPFFVGELLALLGDRANDVLRGTAVTVPAGVEALLGQRLDHLGADADVVLAAAAALGSEFELTEVAQLAERDPGLVLDVFDRGVRLGLLDELGPQGRFAFAHALVQAAIRHRTGATRDALLRSRADRMHADRRAATPGAVGQRVAGTLLAARTEAAEAAIEALVDARLVTSRTILARIAAGARSTGLREGTEPMAPLPIDNPRAGRTVLRLVGPLCRRGERRKAVARAVECGTFARSIGDQQLLVEAALAAADAADLRSGGLRLVEPDLEALLREASGAPGVDDRQRAELMVHLVVATSGTGTTGTGRHDGTSILADGAWRLAERTGQPRVQAEALLALRATSWAPDQDGLRRELAARAVELAEQAVDPLLLARSLEACCVDQLTAGDREGARQRVERLEALAAEETSDPRLGRWASLQRASWCTASGDATGAAVAMEQAASIDVGADIPLQPDDGLATLLLVLAWQQDQLGQSRRSVESARQRWPHVLLWHAAAAGAALAGGDADTAERVVDRILQDGIDHFIPGSTSRGAMAILVGVAAALDHPTAGDLAAALEPHRGGLVVLGQAGVLASVEEVLAQVGAHRPSGGLRRI
jgi:DNA-binding SARP family transcriptional activator